MFSMRPKIGLFTLSLRNMFTPFSTSASATSCGVLTMTAPSIGMSCTRLMWMSPVPGGMSMRRKSSSPQRTCNIICFNALHAIGPLQMRACSGFAKYPMDIHFTPYFSSGMMVSFSPSMMASGISASVAVIFGTDGPYTSASASPTLYPSRARATARLTATVDLPTPPFPEAIPIICFTSESSSNPRSRPGFFLGASSLMMVLISTFVPAGAFLIIAAFALPMRYSARGSRCLANARVTVTEPSPTSTFSTIPSSTIFLSPFAGCSTSWSHCFMLFSVIIIL